MLIEVASLSITLYKTDTATTCIHSPENIHLYRKFLLQPANG